MKLQLPLANKNASLAKVLGISGVVFTADANLMPSLSAFDYIINLCYCFCLFIASLCHAAVNFKLLQNKFKAMP